MHFGKRQREVMAKSWKQGNWFYDKLEPLYQEIVGKAYGCLLSTAGTRSWCQEVTSTALSNFAQKIGATKSHVVHAMLTGEHETLFNGLAPGVWQFGLARHVAMGDWQDSFKEVIDGHITQPEG